MLESVLFDFRTGASVWISEPLPGGWVAAYNFAMQEGVPVLTSIRVYAPAQVAVLRANDQSLGKEKVDDVAGDEVPAGGLSSRALRSLRPTAALRKVLADWPSHPGLSEFLGSPGMREWKELVAEYDEAPTTEPQGRLNRLARVAELYAAGIAQGQPHVNVTIAEKMNRSTSQVRDDVYEARRVGLLTKGVGKGRPAGQLTDKARELLGDTR